MHQRHGVKVDGLDIPDALGTLYYCTSKRSLPAASLLYFCIRNIRWCCVIHSLSLIFLGADPLIATLRLDTRKGNTSSHTSLRPIRIHRVHCQVPMEDTLVAHLQNMEHVDRHPVVSFISALFWVVCESSSILPDKSTDRTVSVFAFVGQGPGGIGHHQCPSSHLFFAILFNDTYSSSSLSPVQHRTGTHNSLNCS